MPTVLKSLLPAACIPLLTQIAWATPVTVTPTGNAGLLASTLAGTGVTITNPVFTGATGSAGIFTGGTQAGLSINSGILLTSGQASSAGTTYSGGAPSTSNYTPGSPLIANSFDADTLSFNFTSTSTTASFNYFFASAEYSDFVNSQFNDEFEFLLNGKNIALVPNTSTPVAINNVNDGGPMAVGSNPSNPQYYVNNDGGQNTSFPYAGLTTEFTAGVSGLTPGAQNTLTLVIADVSDTALDSAVFLQAGSFTNMPMPPTAVPEPGTLTLLCGAMLAFFTIVVKTKYRQNV